MRNEKKSLSERNMDDLRSRLFKTQRFMELIEEHNELIDELEILAQDDETTYGASIQADYWDEKLTIAFNLKEEHNRSNKLVIALARALHVQGEKSQSVDALKVTFRVAPKLHVVVYGYIPNTCAIVETKQMVTREEVVRKVVCVDAEGNVLKHN